MKPKDPAAEQERDGATTAELRLPPNAMLVPFMEIRVGERVPGESRFAYQKTYVYGHLRDLAHSLLGRAEESDHAKGPDEYSDAVAVVLLLAASLEAFINDMLIAYSRRRFGKAYKPVAEGLMGGSLRSQILRLIPVLSEGGKRLDINSHVTGLVFKLIKTRNLVAHSVEHYVENPEDEDDILPGKALTISECQEYAAALDQYFQAVLSGVFALKGTTPWNHALVVDAEPEQGSSHNR